MAASMESIRDLLNAESVAGNLIVGILADRVIVGRTDENGIFELTTEGREMIEALNNPKKQPKKGKAKADAEEASDAAPE